MPTPTAMPLPLPAAGVPAGVVDFIVEMFHWKAVNDLHHINTRGRRMMENIYQV